MDNCQTSIDKKVGWVPLSFSKYTIIFYFQTSRSLMVHIGYLVPIVVLEKPQIALSRSRRFVSLRRLLAALVSPSCSSSSGGTILVS